MKRSVRLVIIVGAIVLTLLLPAAVGAQQAQITLNPTSGYAGNQVLITGTGWNPDGPIEISWDDIPLGSVSPSASGDWIYRINSNDNFAPGGDYHQVKAAQQNGDTKVAVFHVLWTRSDG